MPIRSDREKDFAGLDKLIEEIITKAYTIEEQFWAFRKAFQNNIILPANAWVIGEPVSVIEIDYNGNERCGLTAQCRREEPRSAIPDSPGRGRDAVGTVS